MGSATGAIVLPEARAAVAPCHCPLPASAQPFAAAVCCLTISPVIVLTLQTLALNDMGTTIAHLRDFVRNAPVRADLSLNHLGTCAPCLLPLDRQACRPTHTAN